MPPDYYTLVDPARARGETLPGRDDAGDPRLVTHNARHLMPSWNENALICDTTPSQLFVQPELAFRIAHVAPPESAVPATRGDVNNIAVVEADQWHVVDYAELDAFLGPQAGPLHTVVHTAETVLHNAPSSEQAQRFFDALAQQHAGGWWLLHEQADAAREALDLAGADGYWWSTGSGCGAGAGLLALAARDLIGTTNSWTWSAYNALAQPWRHAFGPLHPDDGEC